MKKKLNQIVAIEKDVKKAAYNDLSTTHHLIQKPASVSGMIGTYAPRDEKGEALPPDTHLVQHRVTDVLEEVREKTIPYFDLVFTKDVGNTHASGDIVFPDGHALMGVPVPTLLFLEKQLTDMHTFFSKLPVLDNDHVWSWDSSQQLWKTEPVRTVRTAKLQKALVLYPATDKHPAQTQLITEDVIVGDWTRIKQSGAMREIDRRALVKRTELALAAVKQAREEANTVEVEEQFMGEKIMNYLLTGKTASEATGTDEIPF